MRNRILQVMAETARQIAGGPATCAAIGRRVVKNLVATTQHMLTFMGAATFVVLCVMLLKPGFAKQVAGMFPVAQKAPTPQKVHISQLENWVETTTRTENQPEEEYKPTPASQRQQQWVASWISKRYRVASEATEMLVGAAYQTATEIKLDPLLILAVMAIESRFNPFAESPMGAQGLMQVMSKVHYDKFQNLGGVEAALDPIANIKVGSMILKEYVMRGGSVEQGLKSYVGAAALDTDFGYGAKVLAEYRKLKDVASGKKVPTSATVTAAKKRAPERLDAKETADEDESAEALPREAKNETTERRTSVQS